MLPEHRPLQMGCGALMLVACLGLWGMSTWRTQRMIEQAHEINHDSEMPPPPKPAPAAPPSAKQQYDHLMQERKYVDALALCKKFMVSTNPDEQKVGREGAAEPLKGLIYEVEQKQDSANYKTYMTQLENLFASMPASDERRRLRDDLENIQRHYEQIQLKVMTDLFASGDAAKIEAACEAAWNDPRGQLPAKEYTEFKMKQWREAKKAGRADQADEILQKAVQRSVCDLTSLSYWGYYMTPVEEALGENAKFQDLLKTGQKYLADGEFALAASYTSAAKRILQGGSVPRDLPPTSFKDSLITLNEALLGLAKQAAEGKLRWFDLDPKKNQFEMLIQYPLNLALETRVQDKNSTKPPAEKYKVSKEAWRVNFDYLQVKLDRLLKLQDWLGALSFSSTVIKYQSERYLYFSGKYLGEDVLSGLPAEIKPRVDKAGKTFDERYTALAQLITQSVYTPEFPGKEKFVDAEITIQSNQAMDALAAKRLSEAFFYMRDLLRRHANHPATIKARDALVAAIKNAQKGNDFGTVYNLAAFFVVERGRGELVPDVKETVAAGLTSAADFFKTSSPMKRAFMLSLLADLLEGDPRGAQAHTEALELGFAAVAKMKLNQPRPAAQTMPSLLPGMSVVAIENSTEYCLLVFFDGPEKFFVRFNPYHRGSVVAKDGTYTKAVIVTSDDVQPYRAQVNLASQFQLSKYEIITTINGKAQEKTSNAFMVGDYQLLRVPPGMGPLTVHPETGFVLPK